jgi:hypothetical protein
MVKSLLIDLVSVRCLLPALRRRGRCSHRGVCRACRGKTAS